MSFLDDAHRDGVVVGLKATGMTVPRRDIDVLLMDHPDTFNLMCMALLELQSANVPWAVDPDFKVNHKDKFSWAQMAGIHGLPLTPWGWEPGKPEEPAPLKPVDGYCAHSKPIFEVWHRPYLSMLEQTLYRQIKNIAERFKNSPTTEKLTQAQKDKYMAAVEEFRLPYYDYFRARGHGRLIPGIREPDVERDAGVPARRRGTATMAFVPYDFSVPQIFTLPNIMIRTYPENDLVLVKNPFFQFKIPERMLTEKEWELSELDITVPASKTKTMRYGADKPRSVTWMNDNLNKLREDTLRLTLTLIEGGFAPMKDGAAPTDSSSVATAQDIYRNLGDVTTNAILVGKDEQKKLLETLQPNSDFRLKPASLPGETKTEEEKKPGDAETGLANNPSGSLEAVHNDYHVFLGGFTGKRTGKGGMDRMVGHMSCVPVSAFDPVFWIHHAQIDRLFAVWQACHPDRWFKDLTDYPGKPDWLKVDLEPFRKSKNPLKYYRPDDCRRIEDFGYTYPDLVDKGKSIEEICAAFTKKYEWSRRLLPFEEVRLSEYRGPPEGMVPLDLSKAQVYQYPSGSSDEYLFDDLAPLPPKGPVVQAEEASLSMHEAEGVSHEWYIDDMFVRTQFNGSATIFYIIETEGGVPGYSSADWTRLPGFVGLTHIFAAPTGTCSNCTSQDKDQTIVTSTTPITSLLLDYVEIGELKSMQADDVLPFLKNHLKWRIQKVTGEVMKPSEVKFRISVSEKIAPLPGKAGFVEYKKYENIMAEIIAASDSTLATTS